jgi:hypothetical protein
VMNATGAISERIDYEEFGNVLADSAPASSRLGLRAFHLAVRIAASS